jgi:lipoic acid synthetase
MPEQMRKPDWLKVMYNPKAVQEVASLMKDLKLNTVCKEANCPNLGECFMKHTATFMILGSHCTRNCKFCNVTHAMPEKVDPHEPENLAKAAEKLGLRHVVITQVTRDDLPDGGAGQFAECLRQLHEHCPDATAEVLTSDMKGKTDCLDLVVQAGPDVFNHNVEMPKELYPLIRPGASYERSLNVLKYVKDMYPDVLTKTGFMVGLGETEDQIDRLLDDLAEVGCDILTIGQYLQPSPQHYPLQRYVTPEEFAHYKEMALNKGFRFVTSTPLVRSSYRAAEAVEAVAAVAESRVS